MIILTAILLLFGSPAISWKPLATDLEIAEVGLQNDSSLTSNLTFLRTSLKEVKPAVIRAADYGWKGARVNALCKASKAMACINSNFFDQEGEALGLVVSRGTVVNPVHWGGNTLTGIFQITRTTLDIINRKQFKPSSVLEAVQAGPRLIENSTGITGLRDTSHARRAGVCIDSSKRLLLYVVSSSVLGISIDELQRLLLSPGIECKDALNLDGGGSAQLFVSGQAPGAAAETSDLLISGYDDVPIALGLFGSQNEW